jgi:uncharacterized membrane protein
VGDTDLAPAGRSMITILTDEHEELAALCDRLREATATDTPVRPVVDVLVATLCRHLSVEEQYLYPTIRRLDLDDGDPARHAGGVTVVERELIADAAMLRCLRRLTAAGRQRRLSAADSLLSAAGDDALGEIVHTLSGQLHRHAVRARDGYLPALAAVCTANELARLGNRVEVAYGAAPTRPHPATPVTPPANKVVDACVGVVDKVRDALARRTTWPEDLEFDPCLPTLDEGK